MLNVKGFKESLSKVTFVFCIFGLQYFTIDCKNDCFGYRGNKITNRFKLYFALIASVLATEIGLLIWVTIITDVSSKESSTHATILGQLTSITSIAFLLLSVIHSYRSTSEMKAIYKNCEDIHKIFEGSLGFDSNYDKFGKSFRKFLIKFWIVFAVFMPIQATFNFFHDPAILQEDIIFFTVPYLFIIANVLRFIFFVMLVNHNIKRMKEFLEIKIKERSLRKQIFGKHLHEHDEFEVFKSLKEIYGLVWRLTNLANSVSGPTISVFFVLIIFANSTSGYMIFLATKGLLPIKDLGGSMI